MGVALRIGTGVLNSTSFTIRAHHQLIDTWRVYLKVDLDGALFAGDGLLVLQISQGSHGHGVSGTQHRHLFPLFVGGRVDQI